MSEIEEIQDFMVPLIIQNLSLVSSSLNEITGRW